MQQKKSAIIFFLFVLVTWLGQWSLSHFASRAGTRKLSSSSSDVIKDFLCDARGVMCPFLVIGHRGAPHRAPENTLASFAEAIFRGANALEIDVASTRDGHIVIIHDRDPDNLISLIRQWGLEGLPYGPEVPPRGSPLRTNVENLTLKQLRQAYGFKGRPPDNYSGPQLDIPTFAEFVEWAKDFPQLTTVVLDIKFDDGQEELAAKMMESVVELLRDSHLRVYFSSPRKGIFKRIKRKLKRLRKREKVAGEVILDLEKYGVIENVQDLDIRGVMMGKTILRRWNSFVKEVKKVVSFKRRRWHKKLYPVIGWTIDDEFKMYRILQLGLDGLITNWPHRLARVLLRHFKDHALVAKYATKCLLENKDRKDWAFCVNGKTINPFGTIGEEEIAKWACTEQGVSSETRDVFGCGAFNKKEIRFVHPIDRSGNVNMWFDPRRNKALVVRPMENYAVEKIPFLLHYNQKRCRDGFLNYDCEYRLSVEYLHPTRGKFYRLKNNNFNYDSSFTFISNLPKNVKIIRVTIFETDDGKIQWDSKAASYLRVRKSVSGPIASRDDTFRGRLKLQTFEYEDLFAQRPGIDFSFEFHQDRCVDGIANHDCEYQVELHAYGRDEKWKTVYDDRLSYDGSFSLFATAPADTMQLKVILKETDDGRAVGRKVIATSYVLFLHGRQVGLISSDGKTFKGRAFIKRFDYDPSTEHSEGIIFRPHGQY